MNILKRFVSNRRKKQAKKIAEDIFRSYEINDSKEAMESFIIDCLEKGVSANGIAVKMCFKFDLTEDKRRRCLSFGCSPWGVVIK